MEIGGSLLFAVEFNEGMTGLHPTFWHRTHMAFCFERFFLPSAI